MDNYRLSGTITVPGDKSISHRAAMLSSIATGKSYINDYSNAIDCKATVDCLKKMGIRMNYHDNTLVIVGTGLRSLKKPSEKLECHDSGTTMRLLSGILASQYFESDLDGNELLRKRPMDRIINPLEKMGAKIKSVDGNGHAPLHIIGKYLKGIEYVPPVASAQVKSAILLAGLYAEGSTIVREPVPTRNHTEVMLKNAGAEIYLMNDEIYLNQCHVLYPFEMDIPGDFSCAAYFICGALMLPDSDITIKHVGLNPSRIGLLKIIKDMGGDYEIDDVHWNGGETYGNLHIRYAPLHGTVIDGSIIANVIDELPIISCMACLAEGKTVIGNAEELKFKESNRLDTTQEGITALGGEVEATDDGLIITGGKKLHGGTVNSYGDHRIAMSFSILSMCIDEPVTIRGKDCAAVSYPAFYDDLKKLTL